MSVDTAQSAAAHRQALVHAAEALSKAHMDSYEDPSHDWLHVQRVRSVATSLARTLELRHDSKYAILSQSLWEDLNTRFFAEQIHAGRITEARAKLVCKICENVSYSKEAKRIKSGTQTTWHDECLELHCVQDADKLDAMGGIGILRCAAYSAAKKRPLLEQGNPDDSISHFHDKLLKLKDMMQTEEGKKAAESRHRSMLVFLDAVADESKQF